MMYPPQKRVLIFINILILIYCLSSLVSVSADDRRTIIWSSGYPMFPMYGGFGMHKGFGLSAGLSAGGGFGGGGYGYGK